MRLNRNLVSLYMLFLLTLISKISCAQVYDELNINNLSVRINSSGDLFNDYINQKSQFEVPINSGKTPAYTSSLWVGGVDDQDQLHIAAQAYRCMAADFWEGPVANAYLPSYVIKYRRVSKIDRSDITQFLQTGVPSQNIIDWPAHGDLTNGEAEFLAPFIDVDKDNKYDPYKGDYPAILGDQAIFFIFNDDRHEHGESKGEKLKIEIHGLAYAFNKPDDRILNNTFFVRYKIINRSENNYFNLYSGVFTDFDLGNYLDDFIGCDSAKSYYYAYNGDSIDEGNSGYGNMPPSLGVVFLNNELKSFIGFYDNNNQNLLNPTTPLEFYNNLNGLWSDGTSINYGGNGYDDYWQKSVTKYLYPHHPILSGDSWSEISANNTPGDRRCLGSTGPFDLYKNGEIILDIAYVFSEPSNNEFLASTVLLDKDVEYIKTFYDSFISSSREHNHNMKKVELFPNPSNGFFHISIPEKNSKDVEISLYNTSGQLIDKSNYSINRENKEVKIALKNLAKGLYIIRIFNNGDIYETLVSIK